MPRQILRDYQERGISQIMDAYRSGARSVLAVSPTGSGKTTLFTSVIADLARARQQSLIMVHRRELASQACNRLREFGIDYGLIMAGEQPRPMAPVQVASVQTIIRRQVPNAKLVVCDEAHLSTAKSWQSVIEQYPKARILGVTATPWRLSGKPLAALYDSVVVVAQPHELREQGHLCDYVGFSYKTPDLSEVATVAGEYNEAQSAKAMGTPQIVDSIVEEWLKHASDLSTVVFAVTVEHSLTICASFRAAGVKAEHLDGSTPAFERDAILARVASGATRVLCNVGVAVEGLDIPRLKCCVLARPTKSLARAIQMAGRVRRPWRDPVTGRWVTARIHDHAFNIKLHGLPDTERDYSLDVKKAKPPSLSQCAECMALYSGNSCPACGKAAEPKELGERVLRTTKDAEQFEFDSSTAEEFTAPKPPIPVRWTTAGRVIEGVFTNKMEQEIDGYNGRYKQVTWVIDGEKRTHHLPGTTHLNALMSRAAKGQTVRVTYVGDQALSAGKARKVFKVEVDQ